MRKMLIYGVLLFQIALVVSLVKGIQLAIKARSRLTDLQVRKEELLAEQNKLKEQLNYVQSTYYVEKVAREELQMARPGETVIIVPDDQEATEIALQAVQEKSDDPNYLKWWKVLIGG